MSAIDQGTYTVISSMARALVTAEDNFLAHINRVTKERDKLAADLEDATAPPKAADEDIKPASVETSKPSKSTQTAETAETKPDGKAAAKAPADPAKKPPVKS